MAFSRCSRGTRLGTMACLHGMSNDTSMPVAADVATMCHGSIRSVAISSAVSSAMAANIARLTVTSRRRLDPVGDHPTPHRQQQDRAAARHGDEAQHDRRFGKLVHEPQAAGEQRPDADVGERGAHPEQELLAIAEGDERPPRPGRQTAPGSAVCRRAHGCSTHAFVAAQSILHAPQRDLRMIVIPATAHPHSVIPATAGIHCTHIVIPAQAGIHGGWRRRWVPVSTGTTVSGGTPKSSFRAGRESTAGKRRWVPVSTGTTVSGGHPHRPSRAGGNPRRSGGGDGSRLHGNDGERRHTYVVTPATAGIHGGWRRRTASQRPSRPGQISRTAGSA